LTLILSEDEVQDLTEMKEVVPVVEECFRQQGLSKAFNSPRTRSLAPGSALNVMHATLPYLGRAGTKCYLGSKKGTRFLFVLFRLDDGEPLAVMGADILGRYRTGAASAVATKFMAGSKSFTFCICGSGKQALTQVLALAEVASLEAVRVWSATRDHRDSFARALAKIGFNASAFESLDEAVEYSDVATAVTSAGEPFLTLRAVKGLDHLNLCGSNSPNRAEAAPDAVASFKTIVVDDLAQSKVEAGDLILSEKAGLFSWEKAVELKDIVSGKAWSSRPGLFKSNGVALEDVALASLLYDKAVKSGLGQEVNLGFGLAS
jgi:ornithine cyclodeaminase/alanine dehydrogenase-like protein (mu-crystallin family)